MKNRLLAIIAAIILAATAVGAVSQVQPAKAQVASSYWSPGLHEPWQWLIGGTFNPNSAADMKGGAGDQPSVYDIDGFLNTAATVSALHAKGYHAICYIEAGSYVADRPDANQFPASVIGKKIDGFSDKWTDIRSSAVKTIVDKRIQMCATKGFDAVEPDLEDGYTNNTGFPLTASDQINFNTWVANTVHGYGMGVLLKGDPEQAKALAPTVDFFLNEQCNQYSECTSYPTGKTILNAEYNKKCPTSAFSLANLDSTLFKVDLNGPRTPCSNSTGPAGPPPTTTTTTTTLPPTTTSSTTTTTQPETTTTVFNPCGS